MNHWEIEAERKAAYAEWLMGLKPGDEVVIPNRSNYERIPLITVVLKITTTQIVVKEHALEVRYNRHDGHRRGASFNTLQPVTDEVREQIKRGEDRKWLTDLTIRSEYIAKIPPAVLEAMRDAYKSAMALHHTAPNHEAP